MATYKESKRERIGAFLAKYSAFAKAAFVLVLVFLVLGLSTIGTAQSTGKAYYAAKDSEVVFYLNYQNSKKLDKVYLNVGTMYTEIGSNSQLTFRRASASDPSNPTWSQTYLGTCKLGNIYSADGTGADSANYNWVEAFDLGKDGNKLSTTYKLIKITFPADMLVNEVVFMDEAGKVIPAYVTHGSLEGVVSNWQSFREVFYNNEHYGDGMDTHKEYADPARLVDAQQTINPGKTVYSSFTQDEMYTLMQIDHILLGNFNPVGVYNANTDVGPLSVLLPMLGVLIFGKSAFGLRVIPVLFSAALVAVAYFLGKRLFKNDGFGFMTAALIAFGGLALTVGRLGLSYPIVAFFALASFYAMYKFFEKGIDGVQPVKSALGSVLLSGLFFALAFVSDPKIIWLALPLIAMFVCGAVRRTRVYNAELRAIQKEMSDKNALEKSEDVMLANIEECEHKEKVVRAGFVYESKIIYLFFALSFIVATALFSVLLALPFNYSYIKLYEANPSSPTLGIFNLVGKAIGDAFHIDNVTKFTAGNASSVFGWLIALKGATLFSASTDAVYSAMNVQANIAMTFTALIALIFMASYTVLYFVTGGKNGAYASEHAPQVLSVFAVLLLGMVASLFSYAFAGQVSAAQGLTFQIFYFALIPLMFYTTNLHDTSVKKKIFGFSMNTTMQVLAAVCAVYILLFLLSVPMYFNIPIAPISAQVCFGWTTLVNNGFYR